MTEPEVIDVEGVEVEEEPSRELAIQPQVSLFPEAQTPGEVVTRARDVATALADVIEQQKLYKQIGGKKHVLVEGWTLLGTMLGVFPVVEWTRPTEDGWEARVSARTLSSAEVGSAEAMCSRAETRWAKADDYAIRSMAQTRATSKAMRLPLGFVMTLAGYEATPSEEMVEKSEPQPESQEFDPGKHLLDGAIPLQGDATVNQLAEQMKHLEPTLDWGAVIKQAWPGERTPEFWRRLSNTLQWINRRGGGGDFPPASTSEIIDGFAWGFSGSVVELVWKKSDAALSAEEQAQMDEGGE
jgi:hypothetical protein